MVATFAAVYHLTRFARSAQHELRGCFDLLAAVVFCVGTTAWILRAWTRRRYWHKSPSDLHYVVAGTALLLSAGIGVAVASQIVVALGYPPAP